MEKALRWHGCRETNRLWIRFGAATLALELGRPTFSIGLSVNDDWERTLAGNFCGWDGPSMTSLAKKFGWSDEDVERLRSLRRVWTNTESRQRRVKALQEKMEAESQEIGG